MNLNSSEKTKSKFRSKSICGNPSHPEILENAGADEADMIIAASDKDESNIVTCELANHLSKFS